MIFHNKKITYFGLDLSDLSFKLAGLQKRKNKFELTNLNRATVPPGYFDNGKIVKMQDSALLIRELINSAQGPKIKTKFAHVCLPEKHTFIKLIKLPIMSEQEIPTAVEWAAEHHLPFTLNEIYFDYQIIPTQNSQDEISIIIGAAPKEIVDDYTKLVKLANLIPLSFKIEAIAIARAIFPEKNNSATTTAIVDLGASRSSLIIANSHAVLFSLSLPESGNQITQIISQTLKISPTQAEKAKVVCGLDPEKCAGGIKIILEKELNLLADKIVNGIKYYQNNFTDTQPIDKIYLCGGGGNLKRLNDVLTEKTGLKSETAPLEKHITLGPKIKLPNTDWLSFTTAIGLTMK